MEPDRLRVAGGRRIEAEDPRRLRWLLDAEILPRLERPGRYVGVTSRRGFERSPTPSALHLLWPGPAEGPRLPTALAALEPALLARGIRPTYSCAPSPDLAVELERHALGLFTHDSWESLRDRELWLVWLEEATQIFGLLRTLDGAGLAARRHEREAGAPRILAAGPICAAGFPLLEPIVDRVLTETEPAQVAEICRQSLATTASQDPTTSTLRWTRGLGAPTEDRGSCRCVAAVELGGPWRIRSRDRQGLAHTRIHLFAASSRLRSQLGHASDERIQVAIDQALAEGQVRIVVAFGWDGERAEDRRAIGVLAEQLARRAGERRRRLQFDLTFLRESTATVAELAQWLAEAELALRRANLAVQCASVGELVRERQLMAAQAGELDWLLELHRHGWNDAETELAPDPKAWDNCARTDGQRPPAPAAANAAHAPTGLCESAPTRSPAAQVERSGVAVGKWRAWRAAVPQHFDYRFEFAKRGRIRHLSQRELGELLLNACHQVGLEVATTGLARPKPKISFGAPLAAGVSGLREIVDLSFSHKHPDPLAALMDRLPKGFVLRKARFVPGGIGRHGLDRIVRAEYAARIPEELLTQVGIESIAARVSALQEQLSAREPKTNDPIHQVLALAISRDTARRDARLSFTLELCGEGKRLRPRDVLERLLGDLDLDLNVLRMRRTRLWAQMNVTGELIAPLDLIDRHVNRLRAHAKRCA